mmetsp:Transcript_19271/g.49608  ORF Transcript_19271/g.49608 Transcript_19271/m.49608 type:complete len:88 (+) Transcript_19271:2-265(+)
MSIYIKAAAQAEAGEAITSVENISTMDASPRHTFADPPSPSRPAGITTSQFDQTKIPGSMPIVAPNMTTSPVRHPESPRKQAPNIFK